MNLVSFGYFPFFCDFLILKKIFHIQKEDLLIYN